ncbi:MAG: hypothetical protein A3I73_04975 [Omnitrophica bacterium RIFCSPLOWO2_02_FULL_45_16]|nr:MAG: hypothetical protein A3I73_04975 [Omnitrophica bacterium RIFCSPLOWO2_02_FULL_45_16]
MLNILEFLNAVSDDMITSPSSPNSKLRTSVEIFLFLYLLFRGRIAESLKKIISNSVLRGFLKILIMSAANSFINSSLSRCLLFKFRTTILILFIFRIS